MKFIYNIVFAVCVFTLCVWNVDANEQPIRTLLETELSSSVVSNQVIDSLQVSEKYEELVAALTQKQAIFEIRYYILAGITLLLVLMFGVLCFFNKRGDKRLEKIVSLLEKSRQKNNKEKNHNAYIEIDETIVAAILENLQAFEIERGFLISKITLHDFAKKIKTNTKYLSKVINTHKLKSFRSYINDLRIQYSLSELKNNARYRKYTVKAMAKESGFSTAESFSKAFQKRTGKTVSNFLKQSHHAISN
ncbi:hypothetical protein IMCC3317_24710 [Kordia antarctica]|uniref:HTH araC/xylS-type domain-containing protein n=1 Tax=Kordia antarctica TaxID=1218801 RepID=A0A7L4ZK59_9FLAO|nr:helix-turn-helix domain-containing protein [Kordia antarctica]QHI37093.1 hypothetical protein IMCC3317_24710 [Kordia antarctica]